MPEVGEQFDLIVPDDGRRYSRGDSVRVMETPPPDRGHHLIAGRHGDHTVLEHVPLLNFPGFMQVTLRRLR